MPEALFTKVDVDETVTLFEMIDYDPPLKIDDEITLTFRDAGHILCSATVFLDTLSLVVSPQRSEAFVQVAWRR